MVQTRATMKPRLRNSLKSLKKLKCYITKMHLMQKKNAVIEEWWN